MSNEIMRYQPQSSLPELREVAKLFAESGFFPDARSMSQAFVKIQTGREMGIPAMASMTGIAIINGKPVVGAGIIAAKVLMAGYKYKVRRIDNAGCEIEFIDRDGSSMGVSSFLEADARAAGLLNKDNWKKWARNMYFSRAISNGQRWYCPDATSGQVVYTPDELGGKVNEEGDPVVDNKGNAIMDVEYSVEPSPAQSDAHDAAEPPQNQQDPYEDPDTRMRSEIVDMSLKIAGGHMEDAISILAEESSFVDKKSGNTVAGVTSTSKLNGKRLQITHNKIKQRYDTWMQENQE